MVDKAPILRIQPDDRKIFWHILRYGLTTQEVVYRLFFDDRDHKPDAARSKLRRLVQGGYLQSVRHPWRYYRLAPPAVDILEPLLGVANGTFQAATGDLRPDPLSQRFAILSFCCLGKTPRRVFIQHEFEAAFPEFAAKGVKSWPYYIEPAKTGSILCYIVVDSFSRRSLQVERVEKQFRRRITMASFGKLDLNGRFQITVLTDSERRRSELMEAFYDEKLNAAQAVSVPQLDRFQGIDDEE